MTRHKARTQEEKRALLKQVDDLVASGQSKKQACANLHIAKTQYSQWKHALNGSASEPARLIKTRNTDTERQLKIENQRLKMIVADQALDIQALKEWSSR